MTVADGAKIIIQIAIAAAASAIVANNSGKPPVKKLKGDPTSLSERGSFSPWVCGARLVGPVIAWAGQRFTQNEKPNNVGKGAPSSGSGVSIFYERGIHVIGVNTGYIRSLRRVIQSGRTILQGPVFPEDNPSGTTISLPESEGVLEIMWGFKDDPVDEWAGDENRVGILSKFPSIIRANWRNKRLGQSPNWPQLEYEYEQEPFDPTGTLLQEDAWIPGEIEDIVVTTNGDLEEPFAPVLAFNWTGEDQNSIGFTGDQSIIPPNKIMISSNVSGSVFVGNTLKLKGPTSEAYGIDSIEVLVTDVEVKVFSNLIFNVTYTEITVESDSFPIAGAFLSVDFFPTGSTSGSPLSGFFLAKVSENEKGGANPAHCIAMAFFADPPFGAKANQSRYDLESLKAVSNTALQEGLRCSPLAKDGATALEVISDLMTDIGCFLVLDSGSGLLTFKMIRPGQVKTYEVPDSSVLGRLDEVTTVVSATRPSRTYWTFNDRELEYREQPIVLSDDGIVRVGGVANATANEITSTTNFETAAVIALRRELEILSDFGGLKSRVGFEGRSIRPGDLVIREGSDTGYLVMEVGPPEDDEAGLEILGVPNGYLAPPTGLELVKQGELAGEPLEVISSAQDRLWILPGGLKTSAQTTSAVNLWIRNSGLATQAVTLLSLNDSTFTSVSVEPNYATGGVLNVEMSDNGLASGAIDEVVVEFTVVGPDSGDILDLTGATESWAQGQQLLVINDEIIFLRSVNFLTENTLQLSGMYRGMFGTTVASHPIGSELFIVQADSWTEISSVFIQSGVEVFYKIQALGAGPAVPLQDLESKSVTPA